MAIRPWLSHYDLGVPQSIEYPSHLLHYFLEESARKFPRSSCTIFQNARISYQEMDHLTDILAAGLAGLGVIKGDRVGLLLPNLPQFILAYFAILKAGAIVVAIDYRFTPTEVILPVNDSGLKVLVVLSDRYSEIKTIQSQTPIQTMIVTAAQEPIGIKHHSMAGKSTAIPAGHPGEGDFWLKELLAQNKQAVRPAVDLKPEDIAIFQYTGGTTGTSKAAMASHGNLVANTLQFKSWLPSLQEGNEVFLAAIPLFHVYGMVLGMLLGISLGAPLVLVANARNMDDLLENIKEFKPSVFPGVPLLYHALSQNRAIQAGTYSLGSLKVCISGSAPLRREVKESFEALSGGKILEGYGLSEAPTATHCNPLHGANKTGSIGMPLPDVDARVVSISNNETEVEVGQVGELIIASPQIMLGYHNKPGETARTLRKLHDGKTWLFTGDVVRMDEDGYFFIVDRLKELIKSGGEQVWPREVEEVISAHPKVLEAGVAGVPDTIMGEMVIAWVVPKPGEIVTASEVQEWCSQRLARYKIPRQVEFRQGLPKTTVGKVLRRELVRQYLENLQA